jgi:TolB-like protein/DNA-binding winged helix-turn-helix (wHTH) protein/tetratricopeptide (TPR) repeat protein
MSTTLPHAARRVLRFGPFEADLHTRELRKHGIRVKLAGMPFEVLAALLDRPGDLVTREELRRRLWPDDTFVDYENSVNSSVARLREALNDSAERPAYVETLPKRGYRFVAEVIDEHASALIPPLSVTPEPALDAVAVPPAVPAPLSRPSHRRQVAIGIGILLAVAGIFFFFFFRPTVLQPENASARRVMLTVLPFANLSGSQDYDFLGDGFTEELITQLARANPDRLGVIARTTAMSYQSGEKNVAQVGRELGVDYVLEGSVRERDGVLRVTAQLIRVSDQTHVWAETFDREMSNLLSVESDVSAAVSRQVHLLLGTPPPAATTNRTTHPDAYEAYLRARYHHAQATVTGLESAIQFYRRAIEIDPNYALAQAGLARAYIFGVRVQPRVALEEAHRAAQRALALDPELPEAQLAAAMARLYYEWDWNGAEQEFRRAIARDGGSADTHFYYSHFLAAVGRHDEAIAEARRAQQLDPHSLLIGHYVGRHYYTARQYDRALEELRRTLDLDPNYTWTHVFLFLTYEKLGRLDEALAHRQKYLTLIGRSAEEASGLARAYAQRGYNAVLEKWIEITLDYFTQTGHLTSAEVVHSYAAMGRHDVAFQWLDRAFADHTRDLIFLNVDPGFDPLRSDPRFRARVEEMRLTPSP